MLLFMIVFFVLMKRRPPRSTRTDTLCPYTTRFRSCDIGMCTFVYGFELFKFQARVTRPRGEIWRNGEGNIINGHGKTPCYLYIALGRAKRSEEHTSELQSLMRISYAVFCLKKKTYKQSIMMRAHATLYIHLHR